MQDFRNLRVWEKAHQRVLDVYKSSSAFPLEEVYGLTSQIRRASVSIGANIAEGCCRQGDSELRRFLQIAIGSASELEYELLLTCDLTLLRSPEYEHLFTEVTEVKRMLAVLIQRLRADS